MLLSLTWWALWAGLLGVWLAFLWRGARCPACLPPAPRFLGWPSYLWAGPYLLAAALCFRFPKILFALQSAGLLVSLLLARQLIRQRLSCRLCWTAHALNFLFWLVSAYRL